MHQEHDHQCADHCHSHDHEHTHSHECPGHCHDHDHSHGCGHCHHEHTPMEELTALMKYMASHNAAHARELAELANQLKAAGNPVAYEQVMAAVSDYEKGNLRLSAVLASLQ